MGWGAFSLVLVLFGCGVAFTAGAVVTYLLAPHHVQIAAHGTPTIFEEAIPGEHQPESVTWPGGEVAIASDGRPARCTFRPVGAGEGDDQVVVLTDHGDLGHPFAPWQWSGEPDVAAPAIVTCSGDGTAALYTGDQAARWRWLGRGNALPLLQVGPIGVAFVALVVAVVWSSRSERRRDERDARGEPREADRDDPTETRGRKVVARGLAIAGAAAAGIALAVQLTVLVAAHDSPSAIDVAADAAGDPHSLRSGPVLLSAERRDVGDLTSCTARGADGGERVLVLHDHSGPWHDNAWNPSEGTDIRHPFADHDFWIGTPDVEHPATIACSHDVQLYGGGEIATWFRYDETSPRLVHATAVPIGWLIFALIAWVVTGP